MILIGLDEKEHAPISDHVSEQDARKSWLAHCYGWAQTIEVLRGKLKVYGVVPRGGKPGSSLLHQMVISLNFIAWTAADEIVAHPSFNRPDLR